MVLLVTSDNEQFVVDKEVAERSVLIKNMLEDVGESDQPIPLPNVSSSVLKKVLEYCEHHRGEPLPTTDTSDNDDARKRTTDISEWDQKFITVDQEMLFEIILAANYLDIKPLLDVGCKTVANMIKGKTPEEIRKLFNIVNDFTPEEEAQIKKENTDLSPNIFCAKPRGRPESHTFPPIAIMPRIPDLPGIPVPPRSEQEQWLRQHVARLCQLEHERFPGSQPVSFGTKDMEKLESQDYWVCEKSDGVRVLLLVQTDAQTKEQAVFIIDRHNSYRQLEGLFFPHHENPMMPLRNTIVDGELVIDIDPRTKQENLRYLAFDCLVVDDQNVMSRTLDKRYGRLQEWFYKPYAKMLKDHPRMAETAPFDIRIKDVKLSYHVDDVFEKDIPALLHGNDGLIYTCVNTPYVAGTDPNILKWKPPSENSIDFKLVLRFPPSPEQPTKPDYFTKPIFELHVWCGGRNYDFWDVLVVTDDEWERYAFSASLALCAQDEPTLLFGNSMKSSGEQFDDRIVEVHWDPQFEGWRMMRFRDDKPDGNHKNVVDNILVSIADGIEKEEVSPTPFSFLPLLSCLLIYILHLLPHPVFLISRPSSHALFDFPHLAL
ncbi:hypothetical protein NM688_g8157 [Phlebia brevispora]|uniref:Uncharacterized protein n=1 Tax=Phlebia brevispora TaxID=194682 RepID=A0ACC1RWJ7_9APHY|nr:hypothetical protein NM688_g8157 [Phlebia brevispora]